MLYDRCDFDVVPSRFGSGIILIKSAMLLGGRLNEKDKERLMIFISVQLRGIGLSLEQLKVGF